MFKVQLQHGVISHDLKHVTSKAIFLPSQSVTERLPRMFHAHQTKLRCSPPLACGQFSTMAATDYSQGTCPHPSLATPGEQQSSLLSLGSSRHTKPAESPPFPGRSHPHLVLWVRSCDCRPPATHPVNGHRSLPAPCCHSTSELRLPTVCCAPLFHTHLHSGGILTGGSGKTKSSDMTYAMPFW